ncbi:hypothetical protein HK098_003501 [Nowakowskiella sp. JEL0407]|nr:hypothetical protein HK098_003501 [Nowakowskiella sp. JEL0407]
MASFRLKVTALEYLIVEFLFKIFIVLKIAEFAGTDVWTDPTASFPNTSTTKEQPDELIRKLLQQLGQQYSTSLNSITPTTDSAVSLNFNFNLSEPTSYSAPSLPLNRNPPQLSHSPTSTSDSTISSPFLMVPAITYPATSFISNDVSPIVPNTKMRRITHNNQAVSFTLQQVPNSYIPPPQWKVRNVLQHFETKPWMTVNDVDLPFYFAKKVFCWGRRGSPEVSKAWSSLKLSWHAAQGIFKYSKSLAGSELDEFLKSPIQNTAMVSGWTSIKKNTQIDFTQLKKLINNGLKRSTSGTYDSIFVSKKKKVIKQVDSVVRKYLKLVKSKQTGFPIREVDELLHTHLWKFNVAESDLESEE